MTEGEFSRKLLKALRTHPALQEAYIVKHANWVAGGVPDFSVSIGKHTEWFELKIHPNKPTRLQAYYLKRLGAGGHLVTIASEWIELESDRYLVAFGDSFQWLVSEIVKLCVNPTVGAV